MRRSPGVLAADPALDASMRDIGEGLGALATVKALEQQTVEQQTHPAPQALLHDAAAAVGGAVLASGALLRGYLDAHDTLESERSLREGLRGVRQSLGAWKTTVGHQKKLQGSLDTTLDDTAPGSLLRRARRTLRQIERLEHLAARIQASWGETGVLEDHRPAQVQRVRAAQARWGLPGTPPAIPIEGSGGLKIVLGILLLGAGLVAGIVIVIAGACTISCGNCAGALVILLGIAIGGLLCWSGVALIRSGSRDRSASKSDPPASLEVGTMLLDALRVPARSGWVDAGVSVEGRGLVRARGSVLLPGGEHVGPEGSDLPAGADALLPGAPRGALVGRSGETLFLPGSEAPLPPERGVLSFAVNQGPQDGILGDFTVEIWSLA